MVPAGCVLLVGCRRKLLKNNHNSQIFTLFWIQIFCNCRFYCGQAKTQKSVRGLAPNAQELAIWLLLLPC